MDDVISLGYNPVKFSFCPQDLRGTVYSVDSSNTLHPAERCSSLLLLLPLLKTNGTRSVYIKLFPGQVFVMDSVNCMLEVKGNTRLFTVCLLTIGLMYYSISIFMLVSYIAHLKKNWSTADSSKAYRETMFGIEETVSGYDLEDSFALQF